MRKNVKYLSTQAFKLHPNGQSSLQLRKHVAWFAWMKGTTTNEKNVVGIDIAILCTHHAARS